MEIKVTRFNAKPFVSPRELAESLGVGESSVKRWADEGRIQVGKTYGGHRRIPITEAIRFIRSSRLPVVRADRLGLENLLPSGNSQIVTGTPSESADRLADFLKSGRIEEAQALLYAEFFSGRAIAAIADETLAPTLAEIGKIWNHSAEGILIEHRATEACSQVVRVLSAFLPPPEPTAPLAFGGAPAGDVYSLPSVLVSATLTEAGFFANNIGPNTPWSVLSLTIDHYHPRLAWISSSAAIAPEEESAFLTGLENLAAKCLSAGTQLVIGGRGLPAAVRTQSIPGLFRLDTLRQLAALARTLTTEPEGAKLDAVLTG